MKYVISRFKKFNLYAYNYEFATVFITANDPDDACYICITNFSSMILKQDNRSEEHTSELQSH